MSLGWWLSSWMIMMMAVNSRIVIAVVTYAVAILILLVFAIPRRRLDNDENGKQQQRIKEKETENFPPKIPFIVLGQTPNWNILSQSLEQHRRENRQALMQLSRALQLALQQQQDTAFIRHWRRKIDKLAHIYESDCNILQKYILVPFPFVQVLPSSSAQSTFTTKSTITDRTNKTNSTDTWTVYTKQNYPTTTPHEQKPYDATRQIIAHLVRDWSVHGAPIRKALYSWCVRQVKQYSNHHTHTSILVPGAGLGRLAWDIANAGDYIVVEAMESSIAMAAAAHSIIMAMMHLHLCEKSQHKQPTSSCYTLHPYAADSFSNEIDSEQRYQTVSIPDVENIPDACRFSSNQNRRLSYTIAEFHPDIMIHNHNTYSCVVSCFFIDTATNIYEYLHTIWDVLVDNGIWINVGPLQWHSNSLIPVSVQELRMILQQFHRDGGDDGGTFRILHWSIDQTSIPYRDDRQHQSTSRYDEYYPLRFVVQKKGRRV